MRTVSSRRTLAALQRYGEELAYERGEEFDPSMWLSPGLIGQLAFAVQTRGPVEAQSGYGRRRERELGQAGGQEAPAWLSAEDLLAEPAWTDGRLVHGELV
jgi:hypothetical protein